MTPLEGKEYEGILFEKYGLKSNYSLMLGKYHGKFIMFNMQIYTRNMKYFRQHRMSKREIIQ